MKKILTLALAIVALTVFTSFSVAQGAQQKDKQKSTNPSVETKPAPPKPPAANAEKLMTEKKMTVKVTKVDEKAQAFTAGGRAWNSSNRIVQDDTEVTFSAKEMKTLPAVGEIIEVTFIQKNPGGTLEARHFSRVLMQ